MPELGKRTETEHSQTTMLQAVAGPVHAILRTVNYSFQRTIRIQAVVPYRIQPQPITIPEDNPFQYDLLDRKEAVETLTRLVGANQGPCVLAVDAPWGAGKTTFLKIWAQYLRNQQFPVVEFNAWETDFSEDPFMALCAELTRGVGEEAGGEHANKVKKAAVEVIKHIGSNAVKKMTGGLVVPAELSAELKEKAVETATEERLTKYQQAQAVIEEFKEKLEDLARARNDGTTQADNGGQKPLVVMIDELDRCRPLVCGRTPGNRQAPL